jgi:thioredoxin reductase
LDNADYDWVIVGGGVHGTHVVQRLLEAGVERDRLVVVERTGELLGNFREKLRTARVESLRSPYVHHVGTEPFGLKTYAKAKGREDELLPTRRNPRRPTVDLFLDHADHVIESRSLDELVVEDEVTDVRYADSGSLSVLTEGNRVSANRVLLAVGNAGMRKEPEWAEVLDTEKVGHVWEDGLEDVGNTYVVGGGTTACSVAVSLARETGDATLVSRHGLRKAAVESDPRWLNWKHIEKELHHLPVASEARHERIRKARNDGTVPYHLAEEVEEERERGALNLRHGEVETALPVGEGVQLLFSDGGTETAARVVLATGFGDVYRQPFVRRVAEDLDLATGHRGMPVLNDETLGWRREDGKPSGVHATGALAEGVLGAFARNIATARRAGDRLTRIAREILSS